MVEDDRQEFGIELQELWCSLALSEEVCNLLLGVHEGKLNFAMSDMMSNKVIVNFKVFSLF